MFLTKKFFPWFDVYIKVKSINPSIILSLCYLYYTMSLFRALNLLNYEYLGKYVHVFQYMERTDAIRTGIGELVALVLACPIYLHNEIEMRS